MADASLNSSYQAFVNCRGVCGPEPSHRSASECDTCPFGQFTQFSLTRRNFRVTTATPGSSIRAYTVISSDAEERRLITALLFDTPEPYDIPVWKFCPSATAIIS